MPEQWDFPTLEAAAPNLYVVCKQLLWDFPDLPDLAAPPRRKAAALALLEAAREAVKKAEG